MYDCVFISYKETNKEENWKKLSSRFPMAKRVDGVQGIHQAHIVGAKLCNTNMFWIVDGDAVLTDEFDMSYVADSWDEDIVHVWRCQNPVNGLVYGYGGVKLFPRLLTIKMDTNRTDMTTSISNKFRAMPEVSNTTNFNTSPFETWKSAFRECCKLSSKIIDRQKNTETESRLNTWCSVGYDSPFGEYAIKGAKQGRLFGETNKKDVSQLKKINDFKWLEERFYENA